MTLASVGSIGSNNKKTFPSSSITITTSAAANSASLVIVVSSSDNVSASDGNTTEVSSITDSAGGNTWVKAREYCNSNASANAGATCSVWYSKLTNQIASSGTITVNYGFSISAMAASAWNFSMNSTSTLQIDSPQDLGVDAGQPGSLSISSLPSKEYLFFRGIAGESSSASALTVSSGYTEITRNQTTGLPEAGNMAVRGEFIITTNTTSTSNPTYVSADHASVFFALEEISATPMPPLLPRFNAMNTLIRM